MSATPSKPATAGAVPQHASLIQRFGIALFALLLSGLAHAEPATEDGQVAAVIQDYLQGSSYNQADQLRRAFHPEARLYLSQGTDGMREVSITEYAGWFSKNPGQFNGRIGRLLGTQVDGNIATAKAEILIGKDQARFVDLFLLKKLGGQWQIISKTATRYPDAFEDKSAAYYKTFPFSIEQRLLESKGLFRHGVRNTSHVEIDGRLITGMNWQSTRDVATAIIQSLEAEAGAARVDPVTSR
ncbi:nuclear transport factor 2 family protein [Stenotrophomonas sp. SY1]|uniref:nuclear transport factor 2 family protein n=1 Tax=Stenotrophomonas sp. SY1 TaxID=477235 RepID=UPI001E47AD52|nr:nuclear transport factor 2 family protein [Stenotrophomonas sp. SY1]MCD9085697.1 nuclear transport factor 2 family protein [Stenotrophomonas sp. SY1]